MSCVNLIQLYVKCGVLMFCHDMIVGVSTRSVEQPISSTNSSNLAAALIDSHPKASSDTQRVKGDVYLLFNYHE